MANPLLAFFQLLSRVVLPRVVVIGIDIQDEHMIAVASARTGNTTKPIASAIVALPASAIEDGEVRNRSALSSGIKELIAALPPALFKPLKGEPIVIISVPPHHVYSETTMFPLMDEKDLQNAVQLKIETALPWPVAETYYDWRRVPVKDPKRIGIFIAAVSKKSLDEYLTAFAEAGRHVAGCEFHLVSMGRFLANEPVPFVFILRDEDGVEFGVFNHGKLIGHYLQRIPSGGDARSIVDDKLRQLVSFVDGNFGVIPQKVLAFGKTGEGPVLNEAPPTAFGGMERFNVSMQSDARFTVAHGASQREYGAEETAINLLPPASSGRFHETLFLRTIRLWTNIGAIFGGTLMVTLALFLMLFLAPAKTTLLKENYSFRASHGERLAQLEPLNGAVAQFNDLVRFAMAASSARSRVGEGLMLLEEEARKVGVSIAGVSVRNATDVLLTVIAPTAENAFAFKRNLDARKSFSSVTFPTEAFGNERNISVRVDIRL